MRKQNICRLIVAFLMLFLAGTLLAPAASATIVVKEETAVNTFVPAGQEEGGLLLHKKVEHPFGDGYTVPSTLKFDFKIELGGFYANAPIATTAGKLKADGEGTLTVSLKAGETIGLQSLRAGQRVCVTELLTEGSGFSVDGEATRWVQIPASGNEELTFLNRYTPKAVQPSAITLKGEKKLKGREWSGDDAFTILLERQTAEGWEVMASRTLKKGETTFDFTADLQKECFSALGNYNYRITEQQGMAESITYDATVYPLCIIVTDRDMDGRLEIADLRGEGVKKVESGYSVFCAFENVYSDPQVPDAPEQDRPVGPADPQQPSEQDPSPDTGEQMNLPLWWVVLGLSLGGLVTLYLTRKHWKRN